MSVDLTPQESEGLKGVYGLKPFFTQWHAKRKDVIVSGHKNCDVDNDHCASCFGKYSHDRNEKCIKCPALCQQGFREHCFHN